jgi:hypothetical protein
MVIAAGDRAAFLTAPASPQPGAGEQSAWEQYAAIQLGSRILAAAWHHPDTLIVGTEAGIAVLRTTLPTTG